MHRSSQLDIATIAEDVCIQIMSRYKNPEWYVHTNYGKAIHLECFKQMFDKRYKSKLETCCLYRDKESSDTEPTVTDIRLCSHYGSQILRKAERASSYQAYLAYIAHRHSILWMQDNMDTIKEVWDQKRGA